MEKDLPSDSSKPSLPRRILQFFKTFKAPDTAEDLEQEIQEILEEGEEQGLISRREGQMINSIFEFRETLAKEIMTPHADMICAPASATIPEVVHLITSKGFTRIPIYSDSPDHIVGMLHAKDILNHCSINNQELQAGELTKQIHFISENQKIFDLLRTFQTRKMHMAVVTDEFGSVRGLITMEDILEEIVGEITDEYDKDERRLRILDKSTLLCDARIDLEEVERHFSVELPEGDYESIGGLIVHTLGRVPEPGISIEVNSLTFHVLSSTKRRIVSVKIKKREK